MDKKKIGIVTIVKCNNYGAELQAFALQRKLNLMGYDAEIIDYLFYKHKDFRHEKSSEPFYRFPLKKRLKEHILPIVERLKSALNSEADTERRQRFDEFHRLNTKFSRTQYDCISKLYAAPPAYAVYCVGSDQVWNPYCYTNLEPYFVTFAPHGRRRVSYASSFGVSAIPQSAEEHYSQCLNKFDSISVREKTGVRLVKELTGKEASLVVDPTLLLSKDEWQEVSCSKLVPQERYLLLYVLKDSERATEVATELSAKHGLKVVRLCKSAAKQDKASSGILDITTAGPADFIGLFANAQMVVTNSFHGTVFSVIFERDFYTVLAEGKDNNSRQTDLLETFGISERLLYEKEAIVERSKIDWAKVRAKSANLLESSENYIRHAIG